MVNRYLLGSIGVLLGIAVIGFLVYSGGWGYVVNRHVASQSGITGVKHIMPVVDKKDEESVANTFPEEPQIKVALVIGNDDYPEKPLNNAAKDARAIAETLKGIGFKVIEPVIDADFDTMISALNTFLREAKHADIALAYYSGHAVQVKDKNYLLPAQTSFEDMGEFNLRKKTIFLSDLQDAASEASGLGVVLLDACRDNPFSEQQTSFAKQLNRSMGNKATTRGLARITEDRDNLFTGFSTKADDTASDGIEGEHGPYARALQIHLTEKGEDIRIVMGKVRDTVKELTSRAQEPATHGSLGGKKWFLAGAATGKPPPFNPIEYREEAKRWLDSDDTSRWEEAFKRIGFLAELDDPVAMRYLGQLYFAGFGSSEHFNVSENIDLACLWLVASAETGNAEAARYLAAGNCE